MLPLGGRIQARVAAPLRLALLLAFALLALLPGRAVAATFTSTTTADGNNGSCGPGPCTLRDAIIAANTAPGNAVSIPAGTYTLTLGELPINQSMVVAGAGARTTTISAQGTSRIFATDFSTDVTIRDVTVTGGVAPPPGPPGAGFPGEGGGILNRGTLRLQRSAVTGNTSMFTGGGISAPFKGDFFGPGTPLTTRIEDSLIANNSVDGPGGVTGGGLNLFGDTTIINTTITGNSVSSASETQGGGLTSGRNFNAASASLTLLNTTIAGNSISGPAAMSFGAGVAGDNFLILPFGPGPLFVELTAKNTLIAGNTINGATQNCGLVQTNSTTFNLSSDASCAFTDAGSKQNANPQLQTLANNGGPTDTVAIADNSPALNTGANSGCPAVDQRGTARPQVATCDIGAFEAKPPDLVVEQRVAGKRKMKKKKRGLASAAARKGGKKVVFVVTITNRGEQAAPGTKLTVKPPKKSKVKLSGCDSVTKQKGKEGKGKGKKSELKRKRKRRKQAQICSLGNLGSGASRTVRIKIPPKGKRKIVSRVSVSSTIADADPTNDSARTKVRVKRAKRRR